MREVIKQKNLIFYAGEEQLVEHLTKSNVGNVQEYIKRLILEDIITNFERVSDHCSNIAVCMIEVRDNGFETHGYLEHLTNEDNPEFAKECMGYYKRYQLPELETTD